MEHWPVRMNAKNFTVQVVELLWQKSCSCLEYRTMSRCTVNCAESTVFLTQMLRRQALAMFSRVFKYLPCLALLTGSVSHAATGDILSVAIATNGWQALVTIDSMATNGTYNLGLGTNNTVESPAAPAVVLQVNRRALMMSDNRQRSIESFTERAPFADRTPITPTTMKQFPVRV